MYASSGSVHGDGNVEHEAEIALMVLASGRAASTPPSAKSQRVGPAPGSSKHPDCLLGNQETLKYVCAPAPIVTTSPYRCVRTVSKKASQEPLRPSAQLFHIIEFVMNIGHRPHALHHWLAHMGSIGNGQKPDGATHGCVGWPEPETGHMYRQHDF